MFNKAVSYDLFTDSACLDAVEQSQRWILSAMHSHGRELVTMLWRFLGNEQDVCDAYQSTFLQLAHYKLRTKPRNVKAYLFKTAGNTAISILRQKISENKKIAAVNYIKNTDNNYNEFDAKNSAETLRFYIAQLPEQLRNIIMLRDLGELSYKDVAKTLGISADTARVYRCKAIQLLAVWMKKDRR